MNYKTYDQYLEEYVGEQWDDEEGDEDEKDFIEQKAKEIERRLDEIEEIEKGKRWI